MLLPPGKLGNDGRLPVGSFGNDDRPPDGRLGKLGRPPDGRLGKPGRPELDGGVSLKLPEAPLVPAEPEKEPPDPFGPLNVPDRPPPLGEAVPLSEPPVPFGPFMEELNEPPFGLNLDWPERLPVPDGPERLDELDAVMVDESMLLEMLPPEPLGPFIDELKPPPLGLRLELWLIENELLPGRLRPGRPESAGTAPDMPATAPPMPTTAAADASFTRIPAFIYESLQ